MGEYEDILCSKGESATGDAILSSVGEFLFELLPASLDMVLSQENSKAIR
jgi:hypothetical protein